MPPPLPSPEGEGVRRAPSGGGGARTNAEAAQADSGRRRAAPKAAAPPPRGVAKHTKWQAGGRPLEWLLLVYP